MTEIASIGMDSLDHLALGRGQVSAANAMADCAIS